MSHLVPIRRALLSVNDKTDLVPFARGLRDLGVMLISTGGTAAALQTAGVEVTPVEQITGFPEILDGRVKTLHPLIHGGLLARRDLPAHRQALEAHGIEPIDLVCINLYPFEQTIRREGVGTAEVIEQIDIGGPALLRSAAKNHAAVTVVTSPGQYDRIVAEMRAHDGGTTLDLRRELAAAAFTRTAAYDTAIGAWMSDAATGTSDRFPDMLNLAFPKLADLRYGENPHQAAALYADPIAAGPSLATARLLHGKPLSFNNLGDAAAAMELVEDLRNGLESRAAAVVVKHGNPCGAAVARAPAEAFERAYQGDPQAAFGGIVALSHAVDPTVAETIASGRKFLELITAPSFEGKALRLLSQRWADVRLLATGSAPAHMRRGRDLRSIPGGLLVQDHDDRPVNPRQWQRVAGPELTPAQLDDAVLVWIAAKHLKSNAVAIGAAGSLLGGGAGQVDRVGACRLALEKAGDRIEAVRRGDHLVIAASDGFFPFPDGPELLIEAGVGCVVQPGGSRRDQETIDLCQRCGVTCILTGDRHFRH